MTASMSDDLHGKANEEVSQIPLSGRVREIPNVKTSSLGSTSNDSFILGSVDRFTPSYVVSSSGCKRSDISIGQGLGDVVYGRHGARCFSRSSEIESLVEGGRCVVQGWMKAVGLEYQLIEGG